MKVRAEVTYTGIRECLCQTFLVSCDNDNVCSFLRQNLSDTTAHSRRSTGKQDGLQLYVSFRVFSSHLIDNVMPYLAVDVQMVFPAEEPHDVQGKDANYDSENSRRPVKPRRHARIYSNFKIFSYLQLRLIKRIQCLNSEGPGSRWFAWRAWGEVSLGVACLTLEACEVGV
jgi:hypothetical protein